MDPTSDGDAVLLIELDHDFTRILTLNVEEHHRGSSFNRGESVDLDRVDLVEPLNDPLGHSHLVLMDFMVQGIDRSDEACKPHGV